MPVVQKLPVKEWGNTADPVVAERKNYAVKGANL
jgi:hypothetical protein